MKATFFLLLGLLWASTKLHSDGVDTYMFQKLIS